MNQYFAFLRGINVGGNNIISMSELRKLCASLGWENVSTYIQSGNVIFESDKGADELVQEFEKVLHEKFGKTILVTIRSLEELTTIVNNNPFQKENPSKVGVLLFHTQIPDDFESKIIIKGNESIFVTKREVYIQYPDGMGRSKIEFPKFANEGTMRNMNTLTKLIQKFS